MKKLVVYAVCMLGMPVVNAQTTAANWTAEDCEGVSHTLFDELNKGKVIVLGWVMPCHECVGPTKAAYNAVQSFAASHPGQVLLYLADDYGDANCIALQNWVTTNSIGNVSRIDFFANTGNTIDMYNYGGAGMPKVVVMGGAGHQVFFNRNDGAANDEPEITNAIAAAIKVCNMPDSGFTVAFDPVTSSFNVTDSGVVKKLPVTTLDGEAINEDQYTGGDKNQVLQMVTDEGIYLVTPADTASGKEVMRMTKQ